MNTGILNLNEYDLSMFYNDCKMKFLVTFMKWILKKYV